MLCPWATLFTLTGSGVNEYLVGQFQAPKWLFAPRVLKWYENEQVQWPGGEM